MKILLVTHYYSTHGGGIEMVAGTLASLLGASHDVVWLASDCDETPKSGSVHFVPMRSNNTIERLTGLPFPLWGPLSLARLWNETGESDIVHVHDFIYFGNWMAFLFALLRHKPVLITQHVGFIPYRNLTLRFVLRVVHATIGRLMLSSAGQVVFVSGVVQEYYARFVRFRRPPLVLANGVDTATFALATLADRQRARAALALDASRPVFLFVGRFVEKKGLHFLEALAKRMPDVSWVFAGWGPIDPRRWNAPNVYALEDRRGAGLVPLYQAADLLVLPSVGEGLPLVLQESMSCGTPAVVGEDTARAVDGPPGIVFGCDVAGPSAVDAWEALLRRILGDARSLANLQRLVADFARARWSWDVCAARYASLFHELARGVTWTPALDADATPRPSANAQSGASGAARRSAWAWASLAVGAAALPFLFGLTGSRMFYVRDLSISFWGRYLWLRQELLSGSFPLWDPFVGAGQSAVADPLHQLFLLPALAVRLIGSDVLGFNLWIAAPFPLAALGSWLFFRRRFGEAASTLGAIAFSLSGPIVSTGNFPNLSWSVAAMPWVLWAIDGAIAAPAQRSIAALALVTSLQAFAGEPVTLLATLVLGLAFAASVGLPSAAPVARRAQLMASVMLGLGLGLAVAAVQLVPLGRAAALSERSTAIARDAWSLHPLALAEMVSLHLFGDFFTSQSTVSLPWLTMLNSGREPFLFSIYFGVPLLGMALLGLAAGGMSRWTIFWTAAGAVSLFSAFGAHTPVYPFFRDHLPLLSAFRFPAKYLVVWSIVVAAAAAAGWEALARPAPGRDLTRARLGAIALPLIVAALAWTAALACLWFPTDSGFRLVAVARSLDAPDPVEAAVYMLRTLPRAASFALLLSIVTAVLLFAGVGARKHAAWARTALFGLIVADLLVKAWGVNPTFNAAHLAEPAWLSLTRADTTGRFYVGGKTDGTLDATDLDSSGAYLNPPGLAGSASRAALSGQANFSPSGWRRREMLSYDLPVLWPREFAEMSRQFFQSGRLERDRLLDRTGVRYRVLPQREAGGRTPIAQVPYLMESFLFDYGGDVAPRALVVSKAEVVGDTGRQIETLFTGGWDTQSTAFIEHEPAPAGDTKPPVAPSATITADAANRVVVEAGVGAAGGYVLLLDSFSDDWRATADGRPATIVRANGLFRAVRLTPGSHVVEFRYRPRAFLVGAAASATALAIVLGLAAWPTLARRVVAGSPNTLADTFSG